MSAAFNKVMQKIEELSSDEKVLLAHRLISSLESKYENGVDLARGELANNRFAELESSAVESVSLESIKTEVKKQTASSYIGAAKKLKARDNVRSTGQYASKDEVMDSLRSILSKAQ